MGMDKFWILGRVLFLSVMGNIYIHTNITKYESSEGGWPVGTNLAGSPGRESFKKIKGAPGSRYSHGELDIVMYSYWQVCIVKPGRKEVKVFWTRGFQVWNTKLNDQ